MITRIAYVQLFGLFMVSFSMHFNVSFIPKRNRGMQVLFNLDDDQNLCVETKDNKQTIV